MATNYPSGTDDFSIPSTPLITPLGEDGGSGRTHVQSHRDLGDAIEALQANVAKNTHTHSGVGPNSGPKLTQANTHQSPDTDTSATALHHTLGIGQYQAASGNHNHNGTNSLNIPISSVTNLQASLDAKINTVDYTSPTPLSQMLTLMLSGS